MDPTDSIDQAINEMVNRIVNEVLNDQVEVPNKKQNQRSGPAPYKIKMCTFWEHYRCNKGDLCTFKHGDSDPLATGNQVTNIKLTPFTDVKNKLDTTRQVWILKRIR